MTPPYAVLTLVVALAATPQQASAAPLNSSADPSSGMQLQLPTKVGEVAPALLRQQAILRTAERWVEVDKEIGLIPENVALQRFAEIRRSKDALSEATTLLTNEQSSPDPEQLKRQEEALRWFIRPVMTLCEGLPWVKNKSTEFGYLVDKQKQKIKELSASVGLLTTYDLDDRSNLTRRAEAGTAIAIGPRLVITNKHVVKNGRLGYQQVSTGTWKLFSQVVAQIEFPKEYARCPDKLVSTTVRVTGIAYADPDPDADFIILTTDKDVPPAVVFAAKPDVVDAEEVGVIGYPGRPAVDFLLPQQIDEIFETPDNKVSFPNVRLSVGRTLPSQNTLLWNYDATTWGGSSGSLLISLRSGQVIGLHTDGLYASKEGLSYNRALVSSRIAAWQQGAVRSGLGK
ncbi:trypsin-like serine peptidase [Pseudomonas sp. NPDC089406]|uniref:trypsin-like serine peptidase n=1 Tax=Pseudomonas sp. NPDC089406 TaxID=3364463 RepID=UPI00384BDB49